MGLTQHHTLSQFSLQNIKQPVVNLHHKAYWNIFRYAGDFIHLFGIAILVAVFQATKSGAGISRKTQLLSTIMFITRYLDLFQYHTLPYLVIYKMLFISLSAYALYLKSKYPSEQDVNDTTQLAPIFIISFICALFYDLRWNFVHTLWAFSEFLEAFSLIPQYVYLYRCPELAQEAVCVYVMSMGVYRILYALNWIYKRSVMKSYFDIVSWICGAIEILFFFDYLSGL